MKPEIDTIFFDVGNTLRIVIKDAPFQAAAEQELMRLVGATEPHDAFFSKLESRWDAYRKQSKRSMLEASEMELWTFWLLPDYPAELIAANAGRLTRLWRDHDGRRIPRHDVKATLQELVRRGYKLGIIANTITETEIPDWMIADGVASCFRTVILSSKVRLRKPDPEIYLLAARTIGSIPAQCAYVGDNPIRDTEGTRASGFAKMILINEPATLKNEPQSADFPLDHTIDEISELLGLFPSRIKATQGDNA